MHIVVTTDDFHPSTMDLFEKYWTPLKDRHPDLKLTAYVPAFYMEFGIKAENDIEHNQDFLDFCNKRKDWLEIVPHCLYHTKPPECLQNRAMQKGMILETLRRMEKYIDGSCLGWKCSFYRGNEDTIGILRELGFSWISEWWYLIPLKMIKKPMPTFIEVPSHTNDARANCPDNIDKIFDKIELRLKIYDRLEHPYATFTELMKMVL